MAAIKKATQPECDGSGNIVNSQEIEKLIKKLDSKLASIRKMH
jgi:hypothetical protein